MPHPVYIVLRWIESSLCYFVQFVTGAHFIALSLLSTDAAILAIGGDAVTFRGVVDVADWLTAGLAGMLFLTFGVFDRMLTSLRYGPGRLVLDLLMAMVMVRGAQFAFHLVLAPLSPLHGRLDHPFFLVVTAGWLLLFFTAFLFPGLAYRRLDALPTLREAWDHHVMLCDVRFARIAVVGSLLIGPLALILPSLRLLP